MTNAQDLATFARQTYGLEGVAQRLLALQDQRGLDVLLLLCAAWLWRLRIGLSIEDWERLRQRHVPIQTGVIAPLRQARRAAAEQPRLAQEYQQLKGLEVAIELRQLQALAQHCLDWAEAAEDDLLSQLHRCCQVQGVVPDAKLEESLKGLASALESD
jgi:uncharacterized protein (TIGR02444 family)